MVTPAELDVLEYLDSVSRGAPRSVVRNDTEPTLHAAFVACQAAGWARIVGEYVDADGYQTYSNEITESGARALRVHRAVAPFL